MPVNRFAQMRLMTNSQLRQAMLYMGSDSNIIRPSFSAISAVVRHIRKQLLNTRFRRAQPENISEVGADPPTSG